ncbi:hypothetical protein LAWI1_G000229 [Lachnellula willkommii]|uniref:Uncharacterized protein n=1 Tax=Lachnellula willkommii TaxID=215461 RepID=A0A559MNC2_9HELO|nr:hypothetical protein LAWI1_G000229 [Lachnellula willkommii]
MAKPLVRRILLPFALLILFYTAFRNTSVVPQPAARYPNHFGEHQELLHVPISRPFVNKSHTWDHWAAVDGFPTNVESKPVELEIPNQDSETAKVPMPLILTVPQNSQRSIPQALLGQLECPRAPNRFTNHIRLPHLLYNISMSPRSAVAREERTFWNPTIFALPYWEKNQYIVVSMVTPNGEALRRNVLCEANICHPKSAAPRLAHEKSCSEDDLGLLGPSGGLRCVTAPIEVTVPPTPAAKCEGREQGFADIPGFHDPRIFYSGRGEPILMVSSQSQYACIGLWAIDLRAVYPELEGTMASSPKRLGPGPVMSYPTLTELTRSPPSSRRSYEKNWVMFSPSSSSSYLQYELTSSRRTIAQLIGGGLTTPNITDPLEEPCLQDPTIGEIAGSHYNENSTWHQATPSLKLILCSRSNSTCNPEIAETVFFAIIQRKNVNILGLPVRYERFVVVWSAAPPFNMLGISRHPILMANETTSSWTAEESWDDVPEALLENRKLWGRITYTTTIAYAWGREEKDVREKGTGYLDDEVILSIGVDDEGQAYARVEVSELLQCLRVCPGREQVSLDESED